MSRIGYAKPAAASQPFSSVERAIRFRNFIVWALPIMEVKAYSWHILIEEIHFSSNHSGFACKLACYRHAGHSMSVLAHVCKGKRKKSRAHLWSFHESVLLQCDLRFGARQVTMRCCWLTWLRAWEMVSGAHGNEFVASTLQA